MAIPIGPIIQVTDLVLTALELRNEILKKQRIELGRSANKMPHAPMTLVQQLSRSAIGTVATLPRHDQGKWIRDSAGEILMFALDPNQGALVELPAGSFKHRRALEKRGVNLFVQDALTGAIVDYKPRRRRMNPLNFKALKRASRRVDAFEKVIKKNFSVGAAKKKRIKRKKRRK